MSSNPKPMAHNFNRPTADLVLKSSDGVEFNVHTLILSESLSVFEGMFSLRSPPSHKVTPVRAGDAASVADQRTVPLKEDSKTLDVLLGVCYSGKGGQIQDLYHLAQVLQAAEKYDMKGVLLQLQESLRNPSFMSKKPMRVYALATRYGLSSVAAAAAKETLLFPSPGPAIPEPHLISSAEYHELLCYRQSCISVAENILEAPDST